MSDNNNVARIRSVYYALEELKSEVVFVGGAVVSLYNDRPSPEARETLDVDIVVEVASYNNYAEIETRLRSKGFENDTESGVICRYKIAGIIVDVMPTDEDILGFRNIWYKEGYRNAIEINIFENAAVKIFPAPYFLASKLDAFEDRGKNDGRMSTDFEDIVYVLNNRNAIWNEMNDARDDLRQFLKDKFAFLLENEYLYEWISAHLDFHEQRRVDFIIGGLKSFISS